MNRMLLIVSILLLIFVSAVYLSSTNEPLRIMACSIGGGKFSTSTKECIDKNCAETSSCQPSYGNSSACKKLKSNLNKNELYFELGMPVRSEGNTYYFHGNAGEDKQVKAIILNDEVETLECEI